MKKDVSKILLYLVTLNINVKDICRVKANMKIFSAYRNTNFFRQARIQYRRVLTQDSKPKDSLLPVRNGSDGLFKIVKGENGIEHRIKNTQNGAYIETFDKKGNLILKSERSQLDTTMELIYDNKVINRIIINNLDKKLE